MGYTFSQRLSHFFHVVSNIRPIVWICLYVCLTPLFAFIYWVLPDSQFRMPEGASTDYGSWLYYSIVTITTLGFGDYTPAHQLAQAVTAIEVMCGLIFLGFFLNAVGSMKSEIDVESEVEKQRQVHNAMESDKLKKSTPMVIHSLNIFMAYCYAVTTPVSERDKSENRYNPDFSFSDLRDLFQPTGLPIDRTNISAVKMLLHCADQTSLMLDSLQQRIDLTLWPELLENCFSFVANCQIFSNTDLMFRNPDKIVFSDNEGGHLTAEKRLSEKIRRWKSDEKVDIDPDLQGVWELYTFIKENTRIATEIEADLSRLAMEKV